MKDKVLEIIEKELGSAEDNLNRALSVFRNMTESELQTEYGNSGKTCAEIIKEYILIKEELLNCIKWLKN